MTNKEEIDALVSAEVQRQLKAAQPTPYPDDDAVARHRDELHQAREARASAFNPFTRSQMAAFRDAAPGGIWRDHHCAPTGPSQAGASGQLTKMSSNAGLPGSRVEPNITGWQVPTPIGPPPGINHIDRLMDAQDRKDKADLIRADAIRRAAELKAKGG